MGWFEFCADRAQRAAARRQSALGLETPPHVARLLERGAASLSLRDSLHLIAYAIVGSPGQRLRLLWMHLGDRDTPRRVRTIRTLAGQLRARLPEHCRVIEGAFERRLFARDLARVPRAVTVLLHRSTPLIVVQPRDEAEVVEVVRFCVERRLPIVPRGVSSSAFGGAVPTRNGVVLDFSAMTRVLGIDPATRTARVQPGVRWADLAARLSLYGLVPMTTPSSRFSTVAGWAATGGLGIESFRYGAFAEALLAARVVTADGCVREVQRADGTLSDFIGTEGQLGLFTELTLEVRTQPSASIPRLLYFADLAGCIGYVERVVAAGAAPSHVAVYDRERMAEENRLFRDHTGFAQAIVEERDAVLIHCDDAEELAKLPPGGDCGGETAARYLWSERFFPLKAQRLGPNILASEVVLALSLIEGFAGKAQRIARRFGVITSIEFAVARAAGDLEGVVIISFPCNASRRLDYVLRLVLVQLTTRAGVRGGGRPYGIGIWNTPVIRAAFSSDQLRALARLKRELDPHGVLNPGKFFRMRTRMHNLLGVFFAPRLYAVAMGVASAASPALGALARVLKARRDSHGPWRIPSLDIGRGRRLLLESAQRCTFCGACVSACPAYLLTGDELVTGRAKLQIAEALARREVVHPQEAHRPFQCFACGLCGEVCQTRLPLLDCYTALEGWIEEVSGRPQELIAAFAARADTERERFARTFSLDLPAWPDREVRT